MYSKVQRFWTYFDKMEPFKPEIVVKWDSRTHLENKFFVFVEPFHSILDLKFARSANISQNFVFFQKFYIFIIIL